ncbi:MAG: DNA primase [Bacteroidetes bacterium]|nr:MAG: DNA primase [Bacteroidota bacterium]
MSNLEGRAHLNPLPVMKEQQENPSRNPLDHSPENPVKAESSADGRLVDDREEEQKNASYDDHVDHAEVKEEALEQQASAEAEAIAEDEAAVEAAGAEDGVVGAEAAVEAVGAEAGAAVEASGDEDAVVGADAAGEELPEEGLSDTENKETKEEARVNFSLLSKEDLVKLLREKLDHPGKANMRRDVEEIKQAFEDKRRAIVEEKKQAFLEEGGSIEDFHPQPDPLEAEVKELMGKYRSLRAEYSKQLEKSKQDNLRKKQAILQEFRGLMEGQDKFETTFRRFKDLQQQWFATGQVPQQNVKDLWNSYNYFVDKFNDYVRINRELRALDLKKNLELKNQLCEKTEALAEEGNAVQAFRTLQKYHARWREIGPVPREQRDEIWERFKKASSLINKRHQQYHVQMRESQVENLQKKELLCEQLEGIAGEEFSSHRAWSEKTKEVLALQKSWKGIGYAPKKDNNAIYARFRKACDLFFNNKAKYYAEAHEEQKANLEKKVVIAEKAEALKDSEDWRTTTNELIRLQKQWKEIGPVPRKDSDKLWKRFRAACDAFFDRKTKFFQGDDSSFEENLKAKEALIAEMDAYELVDDRKQNIEALEQFQERYSAIGFVPGKMKEAVKEQFRKASDRLLERMGLSENERSAYRFKNRVRGIQHAPRSGMKMNFERDKLSNKLQQLKSEIAVWENNIGFFKQSDSSNETIAAFHEKIADAHERIKLLEQKIRILDDMENAN